MIGVGGERSDLGSQSGVQERGDQARESGGQERSDLGSDPGGQERSDLGSEPGYPFSALVGQDQLRLALVLCAVRPEIGGVLIRGEKGTAKSTAVRGLAQVLTAVDAKARLVELPIGAT